MCVNKCHLLIFLAFVIQINGELQSNILSYRKCQNDADCLENSYCMGNTDTIRGFCKCNAGLEMLIRNKTFYYCSTSKVFGEACTYDEECQINLGSRGACIYNTCACPDGSHVYEPDQRCYQTVKLYVEVCKTKANCWLKGNKYGNCDRGFCHCDPGMIPSQTLDDCFESKRLGESCSKDADCSKINNAYCGDVCRCREGYSASLHGVYCLKDDTNFGEKCREDIQCSKYLFDSICSENLTCICPPERHISGKNCIVTAHLGDACQTDEECMSEENLRGNIECKYNVCTCKSGKEGPKCENNGSTIFTLKIFITQLILILIVKMY